MKVTWLALEWPNSHEHSGGVGRYLYRLATEMAQHVDLQVVTLEGADKISGVAFHELPRPRGRLSRYYVSPLRAYLAIRNLEYDVLHSHGDDWYLRGIESYVRTYYGTSRGEARSSSGLRKWNHLILARLEDGSAKRADLKLGISDESVKHFECQHLFPPLLTLPSRRATVRTEVPSIVFIGGFSGRKRGHMILETVMNLREAGVEVDLNVVGPAADRHSWPEWVSHHAGLADDEVADLVATNWILAAPSEYEGFGIPVVEALWLGPPAITSPTPGSEYFSIFDETKDAPLYIVPDIDFAGVCAALISGREAISESMTRQGRLLVQHVAEMGSAERLLAHYREVAQRGVS